MNAVVKHMDSIAMKGWFEHMHRHPELSMHEKHTAEYIAEQLRAIGGYEIATGIGKHGIVATLKVGDGDKVIGLRADFDALPIQEENNLPYKSTVQGLRIYAGMMAIPLCCLARQSIWPRPEISMVLSD
ncbi:hypothetical protein ACFQU7_30555 [Pseudoroseomonas wenyumeiae]